MSPVGTGRTGAAARALVAVAGRPSLWPIAVVTAWRLAPDRWWSRFPFLPVPEAAFWQFRMETGYGPGTIGRPSTGDIVDYLRWCQRSRPPSR